MMAAPSPSSAVKLPRSFNRQVAPIYVGNERASVPPRESRVELGVVFCTELGRFSYAGNLVAPRPCVLRCTGLVRVRLSVPSVWSNGSSAYTLA
jgi:hypothetical protein